MSCELNWSEDEFDTKISVVDEPRFIKLFKAKFTFDDKEKVNKMFLENHQPFEYYVDENWGIDGNCGHYIQGKEIIYQKLKGITLQPKSNFNPRVKLEVSPDPDEDKFDIKEDSIQSIFPLQSLGMLLFVGFS